MRAYRLAAPDSFSGVGQLSSGIDRLSLCRVLSASLRFNSFCLLFLFLVRFLLWLALLDLPLRLCHKLKTAHGFDYAFLW
ncbi:unnamed protein product [Arabidopsis halleri]